MSQLSISSAGSSAAYNRRDAFQQTQQDWQALASALSSNDLTGAQTALDQLQEDSPRIARLLGNGSSGNGSSVNDANNPLATDMQSLSDALSSGDMAAAQKAFDQLQKNMQSIGGGRGHRHHHAGSFPPPGAPSSTTADTDSDGSASQRGSTIDVQA